MTVPKTCEHCDALHPAIHCALKDPSTEALPRAVWSGHIMGIGVHVLDDGRRIIDAEDLTMLFERIGSGDLDAVTFAEAFRSFADGGPVPQSGTGTEER
jgi:hypothetical protein